MKMYRSLAALGLSLVAVCAGVAAFEAVPTCSPPAAHAPDAPTVTSAQAKKLLVEGNARFVAGNSKHPHENAERRTELAKSQNPVAVVLGCADSRTGPEILFDQGLGDLFVVREAGNVVDDHTIGSIEYAAEHLHTPLIVVLGHERCGAIAAARDTIAEHAHAQGHIESLVASIRPAVEETAGKDAEATCKANIRNVVKALRSSDPILKRLVDEGKLQVLGAHYDLDTLTVTYLAD
jgi:carbonic anhydrase